MTKFKKDPPFISLDILVLLISLVFTFVLWRITGSVPQTQSPLYVLIIGICASFLLFGMVFGLSRSEKKAGELEEEHARLVSAIESVPIGLLITDTRGNIVLANYELTRILGNPEGGAWTLAKIDAQLGSVYSVMGTYNEVLLKKRTQTKNQVLFDSRHLDIYMAPIFSEPQGILGVLILVRDVTGL